MNYKEMLNKIIDKSGLSNKEILEKCKEAGEEITPNYLSVLKNKDDRYGSENLSKTLAKVCSAEYENVLVIQAYLDKAPGILIEYLENMYSQAEKSMLDILEKKKDMMEEATYYIYKNELEKKFKDYSLAEFICESSQEIAATDYSSAIDDLEAINENIRAKNNSNKRWALIPIDNDNSIKLLSDEELGAISIN